MKFEEHDNLIGLNIETANLSQLIDTGLLPVINEDGTIAYLADEYDGGEYDFVMFAGGRVVTRQEAATEEYNALAEALN